MKFMVHLILFIIFWNFIYYIYYYSLSIIIVYLYIVIIFFRDFLFYFKSRYSLLNSYMLHLFY